MGKSKRVGIVGVGNVGSTVGYSIAMRGLAHEVILCDHKVERAKGMALDMSQSAQAARMSTSVKVAETPAQLIDCDLVVVTAGSPRLPGMNRNDLLIKNAQIMKEVVRDIKTYSPNAIIIPVSNPLDGNGLCGTQRDRMGEKQGCRNVRHFGQRSNGTLYSRGNF